MTSTRIEKTDKNFILPKLSELERPKPKKRKSPENKQPRERPAEFQIDLTKMIDYKLLGKDQLDHMLQNEELDSPPPTAIWNSNTNRFDFLKPSHSTSHPHGQSLSEAMLNMNDLFTTRKSEETKTNRSTKKLTLSLEEMADIGSWTTTPPFPSILQSSLPQETLPHPLTGYGNVMKTEFMKPTPPARRKLSSSSASSLERKAAEYGFL